MMASVRNIQTNIQTDNMRYGRQLPNVPPDISRSFGYGDDRRPENTSYYSSSITYVPKTVTPPYNSPIPQINGTSSKAEPMYSSYKLDPVNMTHGNANLGYGSYNTRISPPQESMSRNTSDYMGGDLMGSPIISDPVVDVSSRGSTDRGQPQRRPTNRDEFDGPHQLLPRPPPEYVAEQERDLPHLPTNLIVQEQDLVLSRVNDRLSRCAFDFVAKYEFPIPIDSKMRPVEQPNDREWTEWVYLLKRLATKRRIPARVLYNGQIKQFVTILENSLEMRHAARNQSRPLKDDRNILQLISAGIQVAKILKDASAMDYLDCLYVTTEKQIQERCASSCYR